MKFFNMNKKSVLNTPLVISFVTTSLFLYTKKNYTQEVFPNWAHLATNFNIDITFAIFFMIFISFLTIVLLVAYAYFKEDALGIFCFCIFYLYVFLFYVIFLTIILFSGVFIDYVNPYNNKEKKILKKNDLMGILIIIGKGFIAGVEYTF